MNFLLKIGAAGGGAAFFCTTVFLIFVLWATPVWHLQSEAKEEVTMRLAHHVVLPAIPLRPRSCDRWVKVRRLIGYWSKWPVFASEGVFFSYTEPGKDMFPAQTPNSNYGSYAGLSEDGQTLYAGGFSGDPTTVETVKAEKWVCDVTWTRIVDLALPVIGVKNAIRAELKGALVGLQPCYGA
jgi:hypothetical protein